MTPFRKNTLYTVCKTACLLMVMSCQPYASDVPHILTDFIENGAESILPDFSYAGYAYGEKDIPFIAGPIFDVTTFGAFPNDGIDDTEYINLAIIKAGETGGGVVFFPPGKFHVNTDTIKTDIVNINYSNIVMRGSGSGTDGTIIYSGSSTTQAEGHSPWLSPFAFHTGLNIFGTDQFYSVTVEPVLALLTADVTKGDSVLQLSTTEGIKKGDILTIGMRNTTAGGDLMRALMGELDYESFQTSYLNAGVYRSASFQWAVEVETVNDIGHIVICEPARRDILKQYNAFVVKTEMLKQVGIENFRFDCAYKGGYKHHASREHDYGWGAICMHRVSHGWVRNIEINNYVQTTHLVNSRNVTMCDVTLTGHDGHYGPKMYHSSDNLVCDYDVQAKYTHGPGLEGASFGNVYKNIRLAHASPIDFHGISDKGFCPPMYNLYEDITNLTAFAGGGAPQNIPHSGEYNTVWGVEMSGLDHNGYDELFHSWIWRDPKQFHNEMHDDCHKQYVRTILVGVYHKEKQLTIDLSSADRQDEWIYVEGLNKNLHLPSLYETQLNRRLNK